MTNLNPTDLATQAHWDSEWRAIAAPPIVRGRRRYIDAIADVILRFGHGAAGGRVLELGGAPGQWLLFLGRELGCRLSLIDYSEVGVERARVLFDTEQVPVDIQHRDMFDDPGDDEIYDLVYSLGLVEHFDDVRPVVRAHASRLAPGGVVVLGCPSFLGVNGVLKRWLQPASYAVHNVEVMRERSWEGVGDDLGLRCVYRGYVGGFEPSMFAWTERRGIVARGAAFMFRVLGVAANLRGLAWLRKKNSALFSGYFMIAFVRDDAA